MKKIIIKWNNFFEAQYKNKYSWKNKEAKKGAVHILFFVILVENIYKDRYVLRKK
jgi:hypothetical protein